MTELKRRIDRVTYYLNGIARDFTPYFVFEKLRANLFENIASQGLSENARARVNYYNKLNDTFVIEGKNTIGNVSMSSSMYYYDFKQYAKYFGKNTKLNYEFGDTTFIPDVRSIVKSRPISGDNQNSIVMNLDKFRHFRWSDDRLPFEKKAKRAVWRGNLNNPTRRALVEQYGSHPDCDIGHTNKHSIDIPPSPFLSTQEQLQNRYIISIEGNDVATNLKWVLSSRALCMMPRPKYETWFMEGRLVAGVHYVEIRRDFADLGEKIGYFNEHPDEAVEIVRNANAYTRQFRDAPTEDIISMLVLQKYFELSGQAAPIPFAV